MTGSVDWFVGWVSYGLPAEDLDLGRAGASVDPGITGISPGVLSRAGHDGRRAIEALFRPATTLGPGFGKRAHWDDWPEPARCAFVFRELPPEASGLGGHYVIGVVAGRTPGEARHPRGRPYNHAVWLVVSDPGFGTRSFSESGRLYDRLSWATAFLVSSESASNVLREERDILPSIPAGGFPASRSRSLGPTASSGLPSAFVELVTTSAKRVWDPARVFRDILLAASYSADRGALDFTAFARAGVGVLVDPIGRQFGTEVPYSALEVDAKWRAAWPTVAFALIENESSISTPRHSDEEPHLLTLLPTNESPGPLSTDSTNSSSTPVALAHTDLAEPSTVGTPERRRLGAELSTAAPVQANPDVGPDTPSPPSWRWLSGWRYILVLLIAAGLAIALPAVAPLFREHAPPSNEARVLRAFRDLREDMHKLLRRIDRRLARIETRTVQDPAPEPAPAQPQLLADEEPDRNVPTTVDPLLGRTIRDLLFAQTRAQGMWKSLKIEGQGPASAVALSFQDMTSVTDNRDKLAATVAAYRKLPNIAPAAILYLRPTSPQPASAAPTALPLKVQDLLSNSLPELRGLPIRSVCIESTLPSVTAAIATRAFVITTALPDVPLDSPGDVNGLDCLRLSDKDLRDPEIQPSDSP